MQEKEENFPGLSGSPGWLRIILAYGVTIGGILVLAWLVALFPKFWLIDLLLIIVAIPLFPAIQAILLKKRPMTLFLFFRIYAAVFTSLSLQLGLLLLSAPLLAVLVAGALACALLVGAVIAWLIVGLQQLGLDLGSHLSRADMAFLFWVTIGLVSVAGIFYIFTRLVKKHEDRYFSLWAKQFAKIREFFRVPTSRPSMKD